MLRGHRPEPRHHEEDEREHEDRVGQGEEPARAHGPHERGDRDEGVRGDEVASEQEPGDDGSEAAAAQAPLVEQAEVAALPARGHEAEHRHEAEQHTEDGDGYAVDLKALAHVRLNLPGRSAGGLSAGRVFR